MIFNIHAKHEGEYTYKVLLDGDTIHEMDVPQKNLITNFGFDNMVNVSWASGTTTDLWRNYFGTGTGAGTPAVTDTTLFSENNRGSGTGGFPGSLAITVDAINDLLVYEKTLIKQLNFGSASNLTNFGFTDTNTASGYNIVSNFKDTGGSPTTVSVPSGADLQMTHIHRVSLPFIDAPINFNVVNRDIGGTPTLTTPVTANGSIFSTGGTNDHERVFLLFEPKSGPDVSTFRQFGRLNTGTGIPTDPNVGLSGGTVEKFNVNTTALTVTADAYIGASREQFIHHVVPGSVLAAQWFGIFISNNGAGNNSGFRAVLDPGDEFTNASTEDVDIIMHSTWGP